MKRVAVIGLGDISQIHINALSHLEKVQLCAVCDIEPEKGKKWHNILPFYTDYKELFEKEKPDCVHICLPHYLHFPIAKEAVSHGIHVFCEKPMAISVKEAVEFVEMEKDNPHLHIGICLQNRQNESVEELKKIIREGWYGSVKGIRAYVPWSRKREYYQASPWRGKWDLAGSGVLMNQAVHTLDLMYYFGGNIVSLKAMAGQILDYGIEVEDTVAAAILFENGIQGLFMATNANYENESVSIRVSLEKKDFLIQDNCLFALSMDGNHSVIVEDRKMTGSKFYYGASHEKMIAGFYHSLETETQDYVHVKDAMMSVWMIQAILQSSRFSTTVKRNVRY